MRKPMDVSRRRHDASSRKSRLDALSRRLNNQTGMLAVVAHDLRHPLFRIALATDLAGEVCDDRTALARSLDAIREGLASMSRLVEDLDDYGSLQTGRLRLVKRPVHPRAIVESALAEFALLASSKGIALSARIAEGIPEINADRDRLFQVLSNLLANAMCVTPQGESVVVAADLDDGRVQFSVSDSGPGIDPADVPYLFERYWRGTKSWHAGRGLGLAIARDLVECHGGRIWVGNAPGRGACISFDVGRAEI